MRADEILERNPVFLDTETTGLYRSAEIVEVAVVDINGHKLFESLVRPTKPIPAAATSVHGISDEMVAQAPGWGAVWPRLRKLLAGRIVGVYNAPFDLRMLRQSVEQQKMTWAPIGAQVCCVMQMYRKFYPRLGKGKAKKYSLAAACKQFGIDAQQTHGAAVDAKLTAEVFGYLARNGQPAPTPAPAPVPDPPIVVPPIVVPPIVVPPIVVPPTTAPTQAGVAQRRPTTQESPMPSVKAKINIALLQVLLSAAERLNEQSAYHVLRTAALMEQLAKHDDIDAALDRIEAALDMPEHEQDEIEKLREDLGF